MRPLHHRRFFVPPADILAGEVRFSPAQAHQLVRVFRLGTGERVLVFDGTGRELSVALTAATPREVRGRLLEEAWRPTHPRLAVTLGQGLVRGGAMELVLAKATELGVSRIVPLEASRGVRRGSGQAARWLRIVTEAAEQCGRTELPELAAPCPLEAFLGGRPAEQPLLVCADQAGAEPLLGLCADLGGRPALSLLVGGEGGFTESELAACAAAGARAVRLGPRLLRAETAALAALAVVQALLGDWGPPGPGGVSPAGHRIDGGPVAVVAGG